MNEKLNFLAWLIEDTNDVSAEINTPRDQQLREFEAQGFLKHYDCCHGTNFYKIDGSAALGIESYADFLRLPRQCNL